MDGGAGPRSLADQIHSGGSNVERLSCFWKGDLDEVIRYADPSSDAVTVVAANHKGSCFSWRVCGEQHEVVTPPRTPEVHARGGIEISNGINAGSDGPNRLVSPCFTSGPPATSGSTSTSSEGSSDRQQQTASNIKPSRETPSIVSGNTCVFGDHRGDVYGKRYS